MVKKDSGVKDWADLKGKNVVTTAGTTSERLLRKMNDDKQLGMNIISTGAANTIGRVTTGQFAPPSAPTTTGDASTFSISDALNIFLFRRDLDLGVTIKALQARNLAQILAEPNVLAMNGRPASFLAGGEFPFPTLQGGGAGLGAVTIQFREFGVRINFTPQVTPRGAVRLTVTPEVSSLDYANGLVFQGFTIPALSTRRVQTEIELDPGQSFVIGGLQDGYRDSVTDMLTQTTAPMRAILGPWNHSFPNNADRNPTHYFGNYSQEKTKRNYSNIS